MTISELGAIGEFVGSIAVLITLVYLAIQVRQNTRHAQAQMGHDGWLANINNEIAKFSDGAAEALARAELGEGELTDRDIKILDANFRSLLLHLGRVEHLNTLGLEIYSVEQTARAYIDSFNSEIGRAWLASNRQLASTVAPGVVARLEELMGEAESPSRSGSLSDFKRRLGEARSGPG